MIIRLLLTGCRSQEIATLLWNDYRDSHLHLGDATTGQRMVWLRAPAVSDQQLPTSPWVFPSTWTGTSVSLTSVDGFWRHLCSAAGLQDVRLHGLRHTFASYAISQGTPLPVVALLLGHSQTTMKTCS